MNPLALLLLAAAANGGRTPNMPYSTPLRLDTVLDQLHGAVNTLEKVNELSHMGSSVSNALSLPSPSFDEVPTAAPSEKQAAPQQPALQLPAGLDLQNALQALAPVLSMLGGNQNSR